MDLFIDQYYKNEVENKLDYYKILYDPEIGNYTIEGDYLSFVKAGNSLIVVALSSDIDDVHVKDGNEFLQEFKIAANMKRFTLESL
jgi:Zn/Cd-binding protein ZinT